ncbi:MAG: peptidoglycan DD-metalloendopeptidase family protein [Patescibacteria group bacterium]
MKSASILGLFLVLGFVYSSASVAEQNLPVIGGTVLVCGQGNADTPTHLRGSKLEFAWDFCVNGLYRERNIGYPIVATEDGVVVYAQDYRPGQDDWGNCAVIRYKGAEEDEGLNGHLEKLFVKPGEEVKAGQVIGLMGDADGRYNAHLHYQRQQGDNPNGQSISSSFSDGGNPIYGSIVVSRNTALFDQAYSRYGSAMIGYPEYQMWDLDAARRANSSHPWYYAWDPNDLYDARGMPKNCAIWHFNGGFFGDNAIVYDALGGARAAIVLHSGLWTFWTQRGGPRCPAKMPIRDESNVPSNLRSYYKQNYKENAVTRLDGISAIQECTDGVMLWANGLPHFAWYPNCAPGYYENGWHPESSYLFAECYNRNGGSQNLGHAIPGGSGTARVHNWDGYDVQDFRRPDGSKAIIFYDPAGAIHNSCTAEAHCVYDRNILAYFESHGDVDRFGYPTTDQFEMDGKITQDFYEHRSGKHWRLETDGHSVSEIDLSRCVDENKMAKAGADECYRSPDNLIANGSFESCLDCWETPIWPTEHCDINLATPMAEFVMHGNADIWSVQLSQTLPRITAGEKLILSYEQQSVRTVHTMLGLTVQVNGQYVNCGLWQDYRQSPGGWEEHRFPITVTRTASTAKLTWAFGETGGSMFRIRNIRLVSDDSPPPPPPPPPPTCTGEDDPGSFISNGSFTRGLDCWQFTKPAGLDWLVPVVQDDHTLRVSVDHARQWHELSLTQDWVYTQAGSACELVFTGAANPPCAITAVIECSNGAKPLWQGVNLTLASADQPIVLPFWPEVTDPAAKLIFYLGQDAGSVWLRDISVQWRQSASASMAKTLSATPNPLNPSTTISFTLNQAKPVAVEIYDVSGRRVQTLFTGELPSGPQAIIWNGRDDQGQRVASGIYFCRVRSGIEQSERRLIVVR